MSDSQSAPAWLLLPLPANANADPALLATIEQHAGTLPDGFKKLAAELDRVRALASYEPAANRANALVWEQLETLLAAPEKSARAALVHFAREHMPERACARVLRRLAKDPDMEVRRAVARTVRKKKIQEVALPAKKDGAWDTTGWLLPEGEKKITRHKSSRRAQERNGVPTLTKLAEVRKLLNVKSPQQLGFFLLASDAKNGPYTTHTIPKRDGSDRKICAPRSN